MALFARVLYTFSSEEPVELSIKAGETVVILKQDVGDGWWEAESTGGRRGLVPESYMELLPPDLIPPPLPATPLPQHQDNTINNTDHTTTTTTTAAAGSDSATNTAVLDDDWDSDWDDDDYIPECRQNDEITQNVALRHPKRDRAGQSSVKSGGTVKKFNRFSVFVRTGGEAYVLGTVKASTSPTNTYNIIYADNEGPTWESNPQVFSCVITEPHKESKFKGLKSFVAYQITPTHTNYAVTRRYKHFDWLYERMVEKFPCIVIPPLPDKQITGRYDETFIEQRMDGLQMWMNRMCRHPVVSRCEVFQHFLTCADDKQWKPGKRKAEKDEYCGGTFFLTLKKPTVQLNVKEKAVTIDTFSKFARGFDDSLKDMVLISHSNMKKHIGPFKREYQKVGIGFLGLSDAMSLDERPCVQTLTAAVKHTGETYNAIGCLFADQPKYDLIPLLMAFKEYCGILSTFPDILHVHQGALSKYLETVTKHDECKRDQYELASIEDRADTITYATLAEVNHFQLNRIPDFKDIIQSYLRAQILFYQQITEKLQDALTKFDTL